MCLELYTENNTTLVLDTVTKTITTIDFDKFKQLDHKIYEEDIQVGIAQQGNTYNILLGGYGIIYEGSFVTNFNNMDIYNHEIRLKSIIKTKTGFLLQIRCNCWSIFNVEIPLYSEQLIYVAFKDTLIKGRLIAHTPIPYIIVNKHDYNCLQELTNNTLPKSCCFSAFNVLSYNKYNKIVNLYGYKYIDNEINTIVKPISILHNMRKVV